MVHWKHRNGYASDCIIVFLTLLKGIIVKLYVGNLSYNLNEDELRELFMTFGQIASVNIIKDRVTGKSRGFGFVEMVEENDAKNAIANLNGQEIKGLKIKVNESLPKKPSFGGGNNRRFSNNGNGGGYQGNRSNGGGSSSNGNGNRMRSKRFGS